MTTDPVALETKEQRRTPGYWFSDLGILPPSSTYLHLPQSVLLVKSKAVTRSGTAFSFSRKPR